MLTARRSAWSIKNLKIAEFASDETLCFECSLYRDGRRVGTASNQGCGGPNDYHVDKETIDALHRDAHAIVAKKRPGDCADCRLDCCLDCLVDVLITDFERVSQLRRDARKYIVFETDESKQNDSYYRWPKHSSITTEQAQENIRRKHPDARFFDGESFV